MLHLYCAETPSSCTSTDSSRDFNAMACWMHSSMLTMLDLNGSSLPCPCKERLDPSMSQHLVPSHTRSTLTGIQQSAAEPITPGMHGKTCARSVQTSSSDVERSRSQALSVNLSLDCACQHHSNYMLHVAGSVSSDRSFRCVGWMASNNNHSSFG